MRFSIMRDEKLGLDEVSPSERRTSSSSKAHDKGDPFVGQAWASLGK